MSLYCLVYDDGPTSATVAYLAVSEPATSCCVSQNLGPKFWSQTARTATRCAAIRACVRFTVQSGKVVVSKLHTTIALKHAAQTLTGYLGKVRIFAVIVILP